MRAMVLLLVPVLAAAVPSDAAVDDSGPVVVHALAVADTAEGLRGVTARIEARVLEGSGGVFVDTKPLSETDMQGSARLAARVAADTLGERAREHDFLVAFRSQSTVVGGPSAGAVMALAMAAALWQTGHDPWRIDPGVAATGTINLDGTVGPVGGVPAKARGAAEAGLHTVAYPAGQETTRQEGRTVEMAAHCEDLGIRCVPVASLAELIEVATGQRLQRPEPPTPATAELPQLEASVQQQVGVLESRLQAVQQRADAPPEDVAAALQDSAQQLRSARDHLDQGRYYLAATLAFRGLIQQRYAGALMDLHAAPTAATVQEHVDACGAAVAGLDVAATADDWTSLGALAAAQVRVAAAQRLHAEAAQSLAQATHASHWRAALLEASFCRERVDTVQWWASLPDLLPEGAPVEDAASHALDAIDRARDMVSYSVSVQGTAGDAPLLLEEATVHHEAGRFPAAMLQAVEAEAAASVALQAPGGEVSPAVLEEARDGAARAVARAREEGTEPVLSVSLVELSAERDATAALRDLWTARGMALLGPTAAPPPPNFVSLTRPEVPLHVTLALVSGLVVGAMAMLVVWAAVGRR